MTFALKLKNSFRYIGNHNNIWKNVSVFQSKVNVDKMMTVFNSMQ